MPSMTRRLIVAAALALGLAGQVHASDAGVGPVTAGDFTAGSPRAKVTVIEYASSSCPHCARFNNEVFPAFKAKYIDTGKVFYVYRPFMTPPVEIAGAAVLVAVCAGKAKALTVIDAFFKTQAQMYQSGDVIDALHKAGAAADLSASQVDACLDDQKAIDALNARVRGYVDQDKITGTPTFVIGDQRLEGEQTLAALDDAIAKAAGRRH